MEKDTSGVVHEFDLCYQINSGGTQYTRMQTLGGTDWDQWKLIEKIFDFTSTGVTRLLISINNGVALPSINQHIYIDDLRIDEYTE